MYILCQTPLSNFLCMSKLFQHTLFHSLNHALLITKTPSYHIISCSINPPHNLCCSQTFNFQHILCLLYIFICSPCLASIQHKQDCHNISNVPFFNIPNGDLSFHIFPNTSRMLTSSPPIVHLISHGSLCCHVHSRYQMHLLYSKFSPFKLSFQRTCFLHY